MPQTMRSTTVPKTPSPETESMSGGAPGTAQAGGAVPYLAVPDARRALDWYAEVYGARLRGEPIMMEDGRIGHAELDLGPGVIYLADQFPEIGFAAPESGRSPVSLSLHVDDLNAVLARASADGGQVTRPPYDGYGQRNAALLDPFGHRWLLHSPLTAATGGYRDGDVGYASVQVPDGAAATAFYSAVLGWQVRNGRISGATPDASIHGGVSEPGLFCCYVSHDIDAAGERVRAAGGSTAEPVDRPYGTLLDCTDDQGTAFALWRPSAEYRNVPRPPPNGARAGDLAYLSIEVVDSARARAFYGAVLGWTFSPGRVRDGWNVAGTVPMIGLSGGHERAAMVPMWLVEDVGAAVGRIRAAGGTADEPEVQPYGVTADCVDDQGVRFVVGAV